MEFKTGGFKLAGNTVDITHFLEADRLGCNIAEQFQDWSNKRQPVVGLWNEVRSYIFATDTTTTSNSTLPWKNKTTLPKLCQIRDNLYANYMATLFPKQKWFEWQATDKAASQKDKRDSIEAYMYNATQQPRFKEEMAKLILDYIDYGNAIGTVKWVNETIELKDRTQVGYVGPVVERVSPLDIVFNPIASNFENAPKIIRSFVSLGEIKKIISKQADLSGDQHWHELWDYLRRFRQHVSEFTGEITSKDTYYQLDGFDTWRNYLQSNYAEVLTFVGDIYDVETDTFYENYKIMVVDRHKVICKEPNPSYLGQAPVYHVGWRKRQDNLWAMGPLENLVGMQYRVDHVENLKADVFDLITFPPLKIKGYVEEFEWGPMARIVMDTDSEVEMMPPAFQALQANIEIQQYMDHMEAMAGAPKEAMGFRSPGEKTKYEVQQLENAAARIFQSKISQFEEAFVEKILNAMLELARRNMTGTTEIRAFDDEFKMATFMTLTPADVSGNGTIKPIAARNFAEKAEKVQNLTQFFQSAVYQDPMVQQHFSSVKVAEMVSQLLELEDYEIVQAYVRASELAESQLQQQTAQEQLMETAQTPAGIAPGDTDEPIDGAGTSPTPPLNGPVG